MNSARLESTCPSAKGHVQVPAVNFLDQVVSKPDEFKKLCDAIPQQERPGTVMFSIVEICDNPQGRDRPSSAFLNAAPFIFLFY